jgi:hypothetical protein
VKKSQNKKNENLKKMKKMEKKTHLSHSKFSVKVLICTRQEGECKYHTTLRNKNNTNAKK